MKCEIPYTYSQIVERDKKNHRTPNQCNVDKVSHVDKISHVDNDNSIESETIIQTNTKIIFNVIDFINKIYNECVFIKNETYKFVDNGHQSQLDGSLMTIGKRNGGDGHNKENKLLKLSGMIKKSNQWGYISVNKIKKKYENCVINENEIKQLVLSLKHIIEQRCMRHRCYGYRDINNPNKKESHRNAIKWFLNALRKIRKDLINYYNNV